MATGNQVVPGAPASAEHAAAGPPVTAEHAARPDGPHATWPLTPAQVAAQAGPRTAAYAGSADTGFANTGPDGHGYAGSPRRHVPPGERAGREAARTPPRIWPGSGGRWLVWVFRALLWTVLLLIGYRGVAAIVMGTPGPGSAPARPAAPVAVAGGQAGGFPVALAQAYALQFGQAYLNFDPARAAQRSLTLAAFLPQGSDPMFGWNGGAARIMQSEQVAGVTVTDAHRGVVDLLARVNGRLLELGVPVYATGSDMSVSGYPALLPAPAPVTPPRQPRARQDLAAKSSLNRLLPGFFRAYAASDAVRLGVFTAGRSVPGLDGAVRFVRIAHLSVPAFAGATRHLAVTVVWQVGARSGSGQAAKQTAHAAPPARLSMSYAITVVRHRASWLVRSISASAAQPWPVP
jgi:Conjugative transposon protein TcpC